IEETERHVRAGGRLKVADVKRRMRAASDPVQKFMAALTSITSSRDETSVFDRVIGRGAPPDAATRHLFTKRLEAPAGQQPLSTEAPSPEQQRPQMNITDTAPPQTPTKQLTSAD